MKTKRYFVFGSNTKGIHGAGAARFAMQRHGAVYGVGEGPTGNAYAIPTKDDNIETLPISAIELHVDRFIAYAEQHPDQEFSLTAIGTGLAGLSPEEIAPLFKNAPDNVILIDDYGNDFCLAKDWHLNPHREEIV